MREFLAELKRRKVYKVAVFYAGAAWLLLEVADLVAPHLGLPEWTVTLVLLLSALGFPLAVILAWAFDLTAGGVVHTPPAAPDDLSPLSAARIAEFLVFAVLILLVGYLYLDRLSLQERIAAPVPAVAGKTLSPGQYRAIAVLPFVDMSEMGNQAWFAEGIAEELLIALSQVEELQVMARTSSFAFRNTDKTIAEIAGILGVQAVVEGSVRRAGDRVRISAQLVDASSGYQLWSGSYDRQMNDIFQLQGELARSLLQALQVELGMNVEKRLVAEQTGNPEAYAWLLRGRALLDPGNPENLYRSIGFFEKAVEADPDYAVAWGGLATARSLTMVWQPMEEASAPTVQAYERALELDPDQSEALAAKAWVTLELERDWEAAGRLYRRALASRSRAAGSYATTLGTTGYALFWLVPVERMSEAIQIYADAEKLDPLHAGTKAAFATVLIFNGDAEAAVLKAREALELNSQHFFATTTLISAYRSAGNCAAAMEFLRGLPIALQQHPALRLQAGLCQVAQGDTAGARNTYREVMENNASCNGVMPAVRLALSLGEVEEAIDLLECMVEARAWEQLFIRVSFRHDPALQDQPRFLALLKRIGLDDKSVASLAKRFV